MTVSEKNTTPPSLKSVSQSVPNPCLRNQTQGQEGVYICFIHPSFYVCVC